MTAQTALPTGAPFFHYRAAELHAEGVSLAELGKELGTPLYVYSRGALATAWAAYQDACVGHDVLVCFGMKANSNLAVLKEFARLGSGFDIVSGGELARVLAAGAHPAKVVFSGVGKQAWEMQAALEGGSLYNMSSLPIPRLGRPEDMAWLAMFLASDRSSYITGQLISVSGGVYMP